MAMVQGSGFRVQGNNVIPENEIEDVLLIRSERPSIITFK
jgi:hypothetical protein